MRSPKWKGGETCERNAATTRTGRPSRWPRRFFPRLAKVFAARTRIDRRIAALRCVEAVRLYAAAHDGKLPSSLEEIKEAPLPIDPVTGKAFAYHVAGDHAFLTCTPFPGQPTTNVNTPSYELIMKK